MNAVDELRAAVTAATARIAGRDGLSPGLERPRQEGHGDYATNAAMILAGVVGRPPREVAQELADDLDVGPFEKAVSERACAAVAGVGGGGRFVDVASGAASCGMARVAFGDS